MDGMNIFNQFLSTHKPQLISSGVPAQFWQILCKKLTNQIFDAGNVFSLYLIDYDETVKRYEDPTWTVNVSSESGIKANDPSQIYLIDHAWTFRMDAARRQLQEIPGLAERMAGIMGITVDDEPIDVVINEVLRKIWRFSNMYSINAEGISIENRMPIWYIMDELGSAVSHDDDPKFRVVPFIYLNEQVTYSVIFPIKDACEGDPVTRNYVESTDISELERRALLLPWISTDFTSENFISIEPNEQYFMDGHIKEELSELTIDSPCFDTNSKIKVYSEYDIVCEFLTDPLFEIVDDSLDADILWCTTHFKKFKEFSEAYPNKFINQFPYEHVITIKDLLAVVCQRNTNENFDVESLTTYPKWLPTTFNLKTELIKFASYYQNRVQKDLDNHWIVKPWNLARGLDTHITNDIAHLMRLPLTGPKIAQKYIENPVLFDRPEVGGKVKFDIRYVILLKSCDPLKAYVHRKFFLRFANKPFELNNFDDYEKHFTVMNYSQFNLRHLPCDEFLTLWKQQFPDSCWNEIETNICQMFKEMFVGATCKAPPAGISPNPQSRSLYAADLMLSWENGKMQPKLLEVNWVPDCKRACDYYPNFFNDIFKLLFVNVENDEVFREIL